MRPAPVLERAAAGMSGAVARIYLGLFLAFLILPVAVVAAMSLTNQLYLSFPPTGLTSHWYAVVWGQPRWFAATWNSVRIGAAVAALSIVLGTSAALAVARGHLAWAGIVAALVMAPMMLPHVIIAIGLYPTMLDLGLASSYAAVIIGHTVVAAPVVFTTVSASLKGYDRALELAAMTLGAGALRTFRFVTLPMIRGGIIAGGVFAFAVSFDELMLSLFLTSPRTETLPRLLWEHLAQTVTPAIAAVATLILAFTLALIGTVLALGRDEPRTAAGQAP